MKTPHRQILIQPGIKARTGLVTAASPCCPAKIIFFYVKCQAWKQVDDKPIHPWWELNNVTLLPSHCCTDSGSKRHHQCKMAALIVIIFWFNFCTVGGGGPTFWTNQKVYDLNAVIQFNFEVCAGWVHFHFLVIFVLLLHYSTFQIEMLLNVSYFLKYFQLHSS